MNNRIISYIAFTVLTLLWLAFSAALLFNRSALDAAWQVFLGWNLIVKGIVALLALPVVLGMWVWQAPWPWILRLVLVAGLAWVTIYTFFPRKAVQVQGASQ